MKMKTNQAIAKRFKVTKGGKLLKRKSGQDHFNSRESGKVTRKKRRDISMGKEFSKNLKNLMPYN